MLGPEVAHQGDVGLELLARQGDLLAAAHVLDTDGIVVQADGVPGHPGLWHEPVNGAVPGHQEVRRDIDGAPTKQVTPRAAGTDAVEGAPGALEAVCAGPVDNNGPRHDGDLFHLQSVVLADVIPGQLLALRVEADGAINDLQARHGRRPGGGLVLRQGGPCQGG